MNSPKNEKLREELLNALVERIEDRWLLDKLLEEYLPLSLFELLTLVGTSPEYDAYNKHHK